MLHHRAARAATGGRLTEHVNSAGRNLESGGQPPPNSHACAHACLGERGISVVGIVEPKEHVAMNFESGAHACLDERGTSVVRIVEPKEHVAMNFESREQLSTNSLEFCSHVNPFDLDPRNTEVHAAVRRSERGSSPSGNVRVLSTGSVQHYGHEENYGALQKRHLSGEGRQAVDLAKEAQKTINCLLDRLKAKELQKNTHCGAYLLSAR
ncbi:hypothetical protein Ancab_017052 [Ancistrocladus abbreviatus]